MAVASSLLPLRRHLSRATSRPMPRWSCVRCKGNAGDLLGLARANRKVVLLRRRSVGPDERLPALDRHVLHVQHEARSAALQIVERQVQVAEQLAVVGEKTKLA